jgi:hypothetical protein
MRTIAFRIAAYLVLTIAATQAEAAVFERDWKTPGDGLLTYDDVNRRVWLDLSETLLSSQFPGEDPSPRVTRENRYQYVVSQTGAGGMSKDLLSGKLRTLSPWQNRLGLIRRRSMQISTSPLLCP